MGPPGIEPGHIALQATALPFELGTQKPKLQKNIGRENRTLDDGLKTRSFATKLFRQKFYKLLGVGAIHESMVVQIRLWLLVKQLKNVQKLPAC